MPFENKTMQETSLWFVYFIKRTFLFFFFINSTLTGCLVSDQFGLCLTTMLKDL